MEPVSILGVIANLATACGVVGLFFTFRHRIRVAKYQACSQLFHTFFSSTEIDAYSVLIGDALADQNKLENLEQALVNPAGVEALISIRNTVEVTRRRLLFVYFNVKEKLIDPRDVVQMLGQLLKDSDEISTQLEERCKIPNQTLKHFFPEVPSSLAKALKVFK